MKQATGRLKTFWGGWEDHNPVTWLDEHAQIENSDDESFYDQIIAAWERLVANMAHDLVG